MLGVTENITMEVPQKIFLFSVTLARLSCDSLYNIPMAPGLDPFSKTLGQEIFS